MSFQEKLKHKFPVDQKPEKKECDPTSTMMLNKEQCWQFEQAVRDNIKTLVASCLDRAKQA
jgi:hypothetical protein